MIELTKLVENIYPGAYYNQYGKEVAHFNNAKEKEEWDNDERNDRYDDLRYISDKRVEKAEKIDNKLTNVVRDVRNTTVDTAKKMLNNVFGDSELTNMTVDSISNIADIRKNIDICRDLITKYTGIMEKAKKEEDEALYKEAMSKKIKAQSNLRELINKKQEYERNNYN